MSIVSAAGTIRVSGIAADGLAGALTSGNGGVSGSGGGGGGGGLPAWVPPLNVHSIAYAGSTLNSINPDPGGTQAYEAHSTYGAMIEAWSSGIYSPYYSTLGCLGFANGGDNDYFGNQFNVFELDGANALKWRRDIPSFPGSTSLYPSLVTGQQGPTDLFGKMLWSDGSPAIPHTYGALVLLPPSAGGGPKGSALYPIRTFAFLQNSSPWAYRYDLSDGLWHQASNNACSTRNESCWAWDSNRNQAVGFQAVSNDVDRLLIWTPDGTGSGNHSDKPVFPSFALDQDPTSVFLPTIDAFIVHGRINSGVRGLYAFDRGNNDAQYTLNLSAALPAGAGCGVIWVPDFGVRGAIYVISSDPSHLPYIWRVVPPGSSWQTGTWTVTQITINSNVGGVAGLTVNGTFNRAQYVPPTGCIMWVANIGGPMNVYNVVDKSTGLSARTGGLTQTLGSAGAVGLGNNGTNAVQYSATLVPWNASFSTLSSSKHAQALVMADGNAYLFPKDCAPVEFPAAPVQDGNQEIYRFNLNPAGPGVLNTIDIVCPFFIPDSTQIQGSNPDDAFIIRKGNEFYYFFSVDTKPAGQPHVHLPPAGNYATPIDPNLHIAAYLPANAGGDPRYGTWRIAGPVTNPPPADGQDHVPYHGDHAWRGWYDAVYDEFVIPVNCGGQTGFCILDATTFEDRTDYYVGTNTIWSFGQFTGYSNGVAVDEANRKVYMFDNLSCNIGVVDMDAIHNKVRGFGAYPAPLVTTNASLRGTIPDQYGGKICWHPGIRAVCMPLHEWWYVYRPDVGPAGGLTQHNRQDGRFSDWTKDANGNPVNVGAGNGPWLNAYDSFFDPISQDIITYDWIDFNHPTNQSLIGGWYRNHFTLS